MITKKEEIRVKRGLLIILSGPSGVGKGTVKELLMQDKRLNLHYSVSCTTRQPRTGEIDGVHYYFISQENFDQMVQEGEFLEYAQFVGNSYGTPKSKVSEQLDQGKNVLLEIEMQGALQVIKKCPEALSIFLLPPSMEELENRIRHRGTESDDVIRQRLAKARKEIDMKDQYQYHVVNDTVERSAQEIAQIILNHA